MNEIENNMVAIVEVLIFVGGILLGYSYGKGWKKNDFKEVEVKN